MLMRKLKSRKSKPFTHSHTACCQYSGGVLRSSGIELRVRGFPLCSLSPCPSIPVKLTLENSNLPSSGPGRSRPLLSPPPAHTDTQESYLGCLMEIGVELEEKGRWPGVHRGSHAKVGGALCSVRVGSLQGCHSVQATRVGSQRRRHWRYFPPPLRLFPKLVPISALSRPPRATGAGSTLWKERSPDLRLSGRQPRLPAAASLLGATALLPAL